MGQSSTLKPDNLSPSIPPALRQTSQPADQLLNSVNCGVIIRRTAQLKGKHRSEGRQFARELAEYINAHQPGVASVFLYEETFGTKERIHWFIHMRSLDDYPTMVAMGAADEEFRELVLRERVPGGGRWDAMFLDGSLQETVLIPLCGGQTDTLARAADQTVLEEDKILHTANAASIIHLSGLLKYDQAEKGRRSALRLAAKLTEENVGTATAFVYNEGFGSCDRIHWLIHLSSLGKYREFAETFGPAGSRSQEDESRHWREMFVDGSLQEIGLTPQHWGMYATQQK